MNGSGRITIAAVNLAEGAQEQVRLTVSDTGSGMSDEIKARVFEPFFTTKDVGKGTGLGLAQVYGFARQSGGEVRIDSAVGEGTTITLLLPRSHKPLPDEAAPERRPEADVPRPGQCVLLVEDDVEVATLVKEMLLDFGYEVVHAMGAQSALGAKTISANCLTSASATSVSTVRLKHRTPPKADIGSQANAFS